MVRYKQWRSNDAAPSSPTWPQNTDRSAQRWQGQEWQGDAGDWRWSNWQDWSPEGHSTEKSDSWPGQKNWSHEGHSTEKSDSWSGWKWGSGWNKCRNETWNEGWHEGAGSQSFMAKPRREDDSRIAGKE